MEAILTLESERVFTINEVAKIVRVSPRTIGRWIESGKLRAIEIPGRGRTGTEYRIPASAIRELGFYVEDND